MILPLLRRFWDSPTFSTWASFFSKSLNTLVVLPFVLNKLDTPEIALWNLFSVIVSMQILVDFGFGSTLVRVIAYSMGGASNLNEIKKEKETIAASFSKPNWKNIDDIITTMYYIYLILMVVIIFLLVFGGTYLLQKPISYVENKTDSWIAWAILLTGTSISFFGGVFVNYLQGINKIAQLRRWEAITLIGAAITSFVVLYFYHTLLSLVIANQAWVVFGVIRNAWLCKKLEDGRFFHIKKIKLKKEIFKTVWSPSWKSGIGVLLTFGLIQSSGIIYAQFGEVGEVASYLLGLRIIQTISIFSQAPFYSKLPRLNRLFAEGKKNELVTEAKNGMNKAYWVYVISFLLIGLFAQPLFILIKSNAEFVSPLMWGLLGVGFFAERFGAMHLQLYTTTNHVIWHIVTAVSGSIYILTSILLLRWLQSYAFPIAIIAGNFGFYLWYSAIHSYRAFGLKFPSFEKEVVFFPMLVLLVYFLFQIIGLKIFQ